MVRPCPFRDRVDRGGGQGRVAAACRGCELVMSVIEVKTSVLSLAPRVREHGGRIHVRTGGLLQVLALGSYAQTVIIDPGMKRIEVHTRRLWLWTRHRFVPFARVEHIDYRFGSLTTGISWFHGATDRVERFSIDLVLDDDERIRVASFRGAGSVMTGLGGALLGDSLVDWAGSQEDVSRALVERLADIIDVPLGKPLASARVRVCNACGRNARPRETRCTGCGGEIGRA
jgi:hypothetical protein